MNIEELNVIYFSPTGTSRKIVKTIGHEIGISLSNEWDITRLNSDWRKYNGHENSLTIIGVPVYYGRLPIDAVMRLQNIRITKSLAVIVVVYGNRAYDDSLLELRDIARECGFKVIAAAAFIGEHAFSSPAKPIAKERPDKEDIIKAKEFGRMIQVKLSNLTNNIDELKIPGNYPYKERGKLPLLSPETVSNECIRCKICEDICPMNAVKVVSDNVITEKEKCIWCCACAKFCPQKARVFDNSVINEIKERLFNNCKERKDPEFFL